ncbi:CatA-like O-acetyltransferase [Lentisphaerota bacterium WC36G]|nr:CatA-like O-acetyltransferase [Lentisphaerae bacterium WC36]
MNSYKKIDLKSWSRASLYQFYRQFEAPCYNISVKLDGSKIFEYAKKHNYSFFLIVLYAILRATNEVSQIKQRVIDGEAIEFNNVAAMTPIMTDQEIFCQAWCDYFASFEEFKANAEPIIADARNNISNVPQNYSENFICASCSPWLHFESISQAELNFQDSIPILAWGKMKDNLIPISVKFNHCFVDGLHAARFFDSIEKFFANPELLV